MHATPALPIAPPSSAEPLQQIGRVLAGSFPDPIQYALRGHRGAIEEVAYSRDGEILAVVTDNGFLTLWSPPNKTVMQESMIVATGTGIISLWNPTGGEFPREWRHEFENFGPIMPSIQHLAFSPSGRLLAYTCFLPALPTAGRSLIRVLEIASGSQRTTPKDDLEGITRGATSLAFAPNGKTLAVATKDGIALLDPFFGRSKAFLRQDGHLYYANLAFASGTANLLACTALPSRVLIFDVATGRAASDLEAKNDGKRVRLNYNMLMFSPDNRYVAASTDGNEVVVWERTSGKQVVDITEGLGSGWSDGRCCITFAPDGRSLLTASRGSDLTKSFARRRDLSTGRLITQMELPPPPKELIDCHVYPRCFDPGGKTLASVGETQFEGVIVVYDTTRLLGTPLPSGGAERGSP
jgi:WD40 repeat protein